MSVPQPFPYQGSKRKLAHEIVALFPADTQRLIEPFAGSSAVTLRAAHTRRVQRFLLNDINAPLMALWEQIVNQPEALANAYEARWQAQIADKKAFYFAVRERFNQTHQPADLLYLLARCVKASVRYNAQGEFNQSPDNRRKGMHPDRMRQNIMRTSALLKDKTVILAVDYRDALQQATLHDVIYMDPPYQGVVKTQDPRYLQGLSFESFVETLHQLNKRELSYLVSYDGKSGDTEYGQPLPAPLGLKKVELHAGRSSQATLNGQRKITVESLYLSPALQARLDTLSLPVQQLQLWT